MDITRNIQDENLSSQCRDKPEVITFISPECVSISAARILKEISGKVFSDIKVIYTASALLEQADSLEAL